jgi:hypothetical protein
MDYVHNKEVQTCINWDVSFSEAPAAVEGYCVECGTPTVEGPICWECEEKWEPDCRTCNTKNGCRCDQLYDERKDNLWRGEK